MRTLPLSLTLLAALVLAAPVSAQVKIQPQPIAQPIQIFPRQANAELNLLKDKGVQDDLGLDEKQVKGVLNRIEKQKNALKNVKGIDRFKKMKELAKANQKFVEDLLNPKQTKRLKELRFQQKAQNAPLTILKALDVGKDQRKKIIETYKGFQGKRVEILKQTKGNVKQRTEKIAELNKEIMEKITQDLTPNQKMKLKELAGEPFKGLLPAGGGGYSAIIKPGVQPLPLPIQPKKIQIKIKKLKKVQPKKIK